MTSALHIRLQRLTSWLIAASSGVLLATAIGAGSHQVRADEPPSSLPLRVSCLVYDWRHSEWICPDAACPPLIPECSDPFPSDYTEPGFDCICL